MAGGGRARRPLARAQPPSIRRAAQTLCVSLAVLASAASSVAEVLSAHYALPSDVYGHGVLPGGEYAGLVFHLSGDREIAAAAYQAVYEDTAPRLVDLDGDGEAEVITVISYFDRGAALRIWDEVPSPEHPEGSTMVVIAETPPIGRAHRWLAPIGAADLDGDGNIEIAYIDRPHLAKTLRIWRYEGRKLVEVASLNGLTNHRVGQDFITSGIRDCGQGPEIITVDADWSRIVASRLKDGTVTRRDIARFDKNAGLTSALACKAD
ncbi:VCBS repeat-containing protein [Epibacterium sp. DP7N7-1]|nr:VCBS repeat-containing protein [Epibacterium sp. DP7N7-1]